MLPLFTTVLVTHDVIVDDIYDVIHRYSLSCGTPAPPRSIAIINNWLSLHKKLSSKPGRNQPPLKYLLWFLRLLITPLALSSFAIKERKLTIASYTYRRRK